MDPITPTLPALDAPPLSPTPSSFFEDDPVPVIATDELGMIADDELDSPNGSSAVPTPAATGSASDTVTKKRRTRQPRKHVSRHFKLPKRERESRSQLLSPENLGMSANGQDRLPDGPNGGRTLGAARAESEDARPVRRQRQPRKNVSRHFKMPAVERNGQVQLRSPEKQPTMTPPHTPQPTQSMRKARATVRQLPPQSPHETLIQPRIVHGLNIDEDISSDSSLTSVPSDIGPDPFFSPSPSPSPSPARPKLVAVKSKQPRRPTQSPYFPQPHRHKSRPTFISSILPFPALSAPTFGLMQERLAHDPFRLLVATIFLNKTPGARAMPVFYDLMARYPTPHDLAQAKVEDVVDIIHCLGFQNQRARKCVALAQTWASGGEPVRGKRYAKRDYPSKGDGRQIAVGEWIGEADERVAWEIGHLPGLGAYAHDSWRMFCRDVLRGVAQGWNGEGATTTTPRMAADVKRSIEGDVEGKMNSEVADPTHEPEVSNAVENQQEQRVEPEWKRVLPADKELRAWMTWMWLKEGWVWNYKTGERVRASAELMARARGGGVLREEMGREELVVEGWDGDSVDGLDKEPALQERLDVADRPAGAFMRASLGTEDGVEDRT